METTIETTLEQIAQLIQQESLMTFFGHRSELFLRRVDKRARELALMDLRAYLDRLQSSEEERRHLVGLLTVNETSFFRNPSQFEYIKATLLPAIEARRGAELFRTQGQGLGQARYRLKILCAGCSTGEEPYSVAMTLLETLRYPRAWDISILAGDVCDTCLKTACEGFYPETRLKSLSETLRDKYMDRVDGGWRFRDEVRRMIDFRPFNLKDFIADSAYTATNFQLDRFDIIFCRNVMIYFGFAAQQQLVDALYAALAPGGHLLTGDAEPLHLYRHDFNSVAAAGCLLYRKETLETAVDYTAIAAKS